MVAGGLAVAALGTALDWVTFQGFGASGWSGDSRFRIAEWVGESAPIDAAIIGALAAVGAILLLGPLLGIQAPAAPNASWIIGSAIAALGVLEWVYIGDQGQGQIGRGIGIYLVIIGGVATAASSFVPQLLSKR